MLLAGLLLATAPLAVEIIRATPGAAEDARCHPNRIAHASGIGAPLIHPLGDEPQAQALAAVVREVDGCNTPVVLVPQIGQPPVR